MTEKQRDNWQRAVIAGLWAVLLLLVGWIYADASSARADQLKITQALTERVAILEEANRNVRESLKRIEDGINELRRK